MEFIGVAIIVFTALKSAIDLLRKRDYVRLELAQGIAIALEFKLGGEVLRTTLVRDWRELGIVGAICALRAVMTLLIHWEIKGEEGRIGVEAAHNEKVLSKAKTTNGSN
ncbi:MAG: DUF1622 domain-containing protein [Clostridia bacterium]|nr:DUF1622 domain-containing protein [Clostridia bacterium]